MEGSVMITGNINMVTLKAIQSSFDRHAIREMMMAVFTDDSEIVAFVYDFFSRQYRAFMKKQITLMGKMTELMFFAEESGRMQELIAALARRYPTVYRKFEREIYK